MFQFLAILRQHFPPKSLFAVDQIPDLSGQVVVVTGGNAGIGKETVKVLLEHNARVYIAARSPARAEQAIRELESATGRTAHFLEMDLGNLSSIKTAVDEFMSKEKQLHVLCNNAGVMKTPVSELTQDGYDQQWGTNVLGHFYLTKLLLPVLESTATTDFKPRVVTLTSAAHYNGELNFNTFKDGPARTKAVNKWYIPSGLMSWFLYSQSKYGNLVFSQELARRYEAEDIISIAIHPGSIRTELWKHQSWLEGKLVALGLHDTQHGALSSLFAATVPQAASMNGKYIGPWAREAPPKDNNVQLGKELWTWLEEQTVKF